MIVDVLGEAQVSDALERVPAYMVGQKVLWVALVNEPKHYMPDEKVEATVLHSFWNGRLGFTYRLRLERVWRPEMAKLYAGERIIVGNVAESRLRPHS